MTRANRRSHSPAWQAARNARRARRDQLRARGLLAEQARDGLGFIIKRGNDGTTTLADPGARDRALWQAASADRTAA
ncbi:MAG: hypothetical protein ACRDOK_21050 [Streptosporangiaceae bacterium]